MNVVVVERPAPARCPYCLDGLGGDTSTCAGCGTVLHAGCRASLGRCPTLGCATTTEAPRPEAPRPDAAAPPGAVGRAVGALFGVTGAAVGAVLALLLGAHLGDDLALLAGLGLAAALAAAAYATGRRLGDHLAAAVRRAWHRLRALARGALEAWRAWSGAGVTAPVGPERPAGSIPGPRAVAAGGLGLALTAGLAAVLGDDMALVGGLLLTGVAVALAQRRREARA